MISVTVTPTFTDDTLTFELPDGPISEAVVKTLLNAIGTLPGEVTKFRSVVVKAKTEGDFTLQN